MSKSQLFKVKKPIHTAAQIGKLASAMLLAFCCAHSWAQVTAPQPVPRIQFAPENQKICKDYFELLSKAKPREQLPICSSQVDLLPGAQPVPWEELAISDNLELLHKIEWLLRGHLKPAPAPDFSDWLLQFQRRAKNPANLPRVKQALVTVEPGVPPQLIYSYEEAGPSCSPKKMAAWKNGIGTFVLFDDEVKKGHDWSWKRGRAFIYENRFHLFYSYPNDKTHYLEWTAIIEIFDGEKFRQGKYSEYESKTVCSFQDSEIFYPPPRK